MSKRNIIGGTVNIINIVGNWSSNIKFGSRYLANFFYVL